MQLEITIQTQSTGEFVVWDCSSAPSPGDLPNPGIEPRAPELQADSLPSEPPGKWLKSYWTVKGIEELLDNESPEVTEITTDTGICQWRDSVRQIHVSILPQTPIQAAT